MKEFFEDMPVRDGYDLGACEIMAATDKALLVYWDLSETWIPKSQILLDTSSVMKGDFLEVIVSEWFATQKGWL
jgi:hypothetical protein